MKNKFKRIFKYTVVMLVLALLIPVVLSTQAFDDDIDTSEPETIEIGKGMEIMPNLETETETIELEIDTVIVPRFRTFSLDPLAAEVGYFGSFTGKSGTTVNIFRTETGTSAYTYVENYGVGSGIVAILAEGTQRYKVAIAGTIGWIEKSALSLTSFTNATSYNYYEINDSNNELYHYISYSAVGTSGTSITQGEAPSYLVKGSKYLSFDGHYFYPATAAGYNLLIQDYNAGVRTNSVNPTNPFYNYFQWLPARAQTALTAADFRTYLTNAGYNSTFKSRLYEMEQLFIDYGNYFGGNPALGFAMAVHESGWGDSGFSRARNNFFGHAAYDSSPGSASSYPTPAYGLRTHFARFWNWNYLDGDPGNNPYYYGGFVGDKELGMNVKYASDPYWGEKIAQHYYRMDKLTGQKDYKRYTLGIMNGKETIRNATNTTSASIVYTSKYAGIPIAITNVTTSSGTKYYQFTSDHILGTDKKLRPWGGYLYDRFDIANSQLYVDASKVTIVSQGTNSKLLTQTNPTLPTWPSFDTATTQLTTTVGAALRPDPSSTYSTILTIPKGTVLTGYKTSNNWFQVVYVNPSSGREYLGYISMTQLTDGTVPTPEPEELPPAGTISYKVNATAGLRMRKSPSTDSDTILTLSNNTLVTGGTPLNGWIRISYNNQVGYASADFLVKVETPTPTPDPTPTVSLGDLNGDKKISVVDMAMLQAHLTKKYTLKDAEFTAGDINKDGKITVVDMAMLQAHLTKKYTIEGW